MIVVKDAMVLIHMAKITLLQASCSYFQSVLIPSLVYEEVVVRGRKEGFPDAVLIEELVEERNINVKEVEKTELLTRAHQFNIQEGEAEAVALYWQENADYLVTDDDNVRKKEEILELQLLSTPSLLLHLYGEHEISKAKFHRAIDTLRDIGWFSNVVLDEIERRGQL